MKNNLTEMVFVIDMSGSMAPLTSDTIGGFNGVIDRQKKEEGRALVTTYLFNDKSVMVQDRVDLEKIGHLTEKEYVASGCTALCDALGGAIKHIANIHRYARPEDVPEHTIFTIITDGMENSSHEFSSDKVKKMIEHEKEKYGWEFVFFGANIDAVETAARYGIDAPRAVNYRPDTKGTEVAYGCIDACVSSVRKCISLDACVDWREKADSDFENRWE